VFAVPRDETETVLDGGRGDEGVGKSDSELLRDPTGTLGHSPVDAEFSERRKQLAGEVRRGVAGEEFGAGDHRVVEPVATGYESNRAAEVVDEDVGVDEEISHAATRRATAPLQTVRHQTSP